MTTEPIQGENSIPTCTYRVLSTKTGNPVRFASIGDQLIHQWSCKTRLFFNYNISCMIFL